MTEKMPWTHKIALIVIILGCLLVHYLIIGHSLPVEATKQADPAPDTNIPTLAKAAGRGYWCYQNEDGSMGDFMGGDYDFYLKQKKYEKEHPESYLTGANLLFYQKLKSIEESPAPDTPWIGSQIGFQINMDVSPEFEQHLTNLIEQYFKELKEKAEPNVPRTDGKKTAPNFIGKKSKHEWRDESKWLSISWYC